MRNERRQEQQNEENKKREEATASILIDNGNAMLTKTYIPILSRVSPQVVGGLQRHIRIEGHVQEVATFISRNDCRKALPIRYDAKAIAKT